MKTLLEPKPVEKVCIECGNPWTFEFSEFLAGIVHVCPECSEKHAEEESRRLAQQSAGYREQSWKAICPPDFLTIDPRLLPYPPRLAEVLKWQFGPKGLLLHGGTGAGKSRIAWALLRREFVAGRSVRSINHGAGLKYGALFTQSTQAAEDWVKGLIEPDILFMDDVFKSKLTDSWEAALFTVVSSRTEKRRPIIVTCNDEGSTLIKRTTDDRGAALIRRLREFCKAISF